MTEEKITFRARIARLQNAVELLRDIGAALQDEAARMEAAQARFESRKATAPTKSRKHERPPRP